MMTDTKRTKTQTRSHAEMMLELMDIEAGIRERHLKKTLVPEGWTEISSAPPTRKRAKMTLRVDEDVHRWFRAQGPGYQSRINQVLRVFMLGVISKELAGAYDTDWRGEPI